MKYFPVFLHIVLITVTVAAENVAPILMARAGQNTETIQTRPNNCLTGDVSVVDACQEDYYPCTCETYSFDLIPSLYVHCTEVPSFESVQAAFRRTTASQVKEFILTIPSFEVNKTIPADLLSGKAAQQITLICPSTETQLTADPKAFNLSEDYANFIKFSSCDLSQLNYTFLTNFNVLREISYLNSINVSPWISLPTLPSLRKLSVDGSPDFKDFNNLPVSRLPAVSEYSIRLGPKFELLPNTTTMKMLKIESCPLFKQWHILAQQSKMTSLALINLDSQAVKDAIDSILSTDSVDTMTDLTLSGNGLEQVPAEITLFSQLKSCILSQNNIAVAVNGSLSFSTPNLQTLILSSNGLDTIEPDAFRGDFSKSRITLSYNKLSRLESSVFKPILEQMIVATGQYGYFEIYENPIVCDCHLYWLFVENNHLLSRVYAQCSNGTYFSSLTPQHFSSCKSDSTTTNKPSTTSATGGASTSHQLLAGPVHFIILLFIVLCF